MPEEGYRRNPGPRLSLWQAVPLPPPGILANLVTLSSCQQHLPTLRPLPFLRCPCCESLVVPTFTRLSVGRTSACRRRHPAGDIAQNPGPTATSTLATAAAPFAPLLFRPGRRKARRLRCRPPPAGVAPMEEDEPAALAAALEEEREW